MKWKDVEKSGKNGGWLWTSYFYKIRNLMFIGEYSHKIDNKKRLAIPSDFRSDLGDKAVITRGFENCLFLYTQSTWKERAKKISERSSLKSDARGLARVMLAGAREVELDNLGRILIPDYLKEYAELEKNVTVAGLYNRIEIWDEDKWQEYRQKTEQEIGDIAERLEELGINDSAS